MNLEHHILYERLGGTCSQCGRFFDNSQITRGDGKGLCVYTPFAREPAAMLTAIEEVRDIDNFEGFEGDCLSTVRSPIAGERGEGKGWFAHCSFKLCGEAGEFAEHVGKAMRDDGFDITDLSTLTNERRLSLLKELGDVLWYVVILAGLLGSSMLGVVRLNVWKRRGRKERGTLLGSGDNR